MVPMESESTVSKEEPEKPMETTADSAADKEATVEIEKVEQVEKKDPEPSFQLLSNPARVLTQQVTRFVCACNITGGHGQAPIFTVPLPAIDRRSHSVSRIYRVIMA